MQPLEAFLKTNVRQNRFHSIERVTEFIMTPGLVNEILTGVACGHDLGPALTTRHYVVSTCRDLPLTKNAREFLSFDFRILISAN